MCHSCDAEAMVWELERGGGFRVLRRLSVNEGRTGEGSSEGAATGVVVDTETTGLDPERHRIIELAVRRFEFDASGTITNIDPARTWLEDPGVRLDPEITRLTGICDADLAGQAIDGTAASELIRSASVVIAHNAGFDRKFLERRLPAVAGMPWACSCAEVDWAARGFSGRSLGWLMVQYGFFHGAHRASADVDAVLAVLGHRTMLGETALAELLERAATPGWLVRAVGAAFDVKDSLKARRYRWDGTSKVWWREVPEPQRQAETEWLAEHVYADRHRPRAPGPSLEPVTWLTRHG